MSTRAAGALLLAAALAAPLAGAAGSTVTLLEAEGELLAGAAGAEVGDPARALPAPARPVGPVSHAAHAFQVPDCPHFLGVTAEANTLGTDPETWRDVGAFDPALIRVEVRHANGTAVAGEFGRELAFTTEDAVGPGGYALHVTHLVGGPIAYEAAVVGGPACP